jgi:uncharacterized protein (DUF169 family)
MKENHAVTLELPPVGIKLLDEKALDEFKDTTLFSGVSYCQAVFGATFGMELLLNASSIRVCKWSPVVLGLKQAENDFERSVSTYIEPYIHGIYMAPLHLFRKGVKPDGVIIRTNPDHYRKIIDLLGWDSFIDPASYKQDQSALNTFKMKPPTGLSAIAIKYVNRLLSMLNRFTLWHRFTTFLFKSEFVTKVFDKFITRYMANMSMCRNSFVIPWQQGKANISYFCTGGVAWGKNEPDDMTSGYPYETFLRLDPYLDYPGKFPEDHRLRRLDKIRKRLLGAAKAKGYTLAPIDGRGA